MEAAPGRRQGRPRRVVSRPAAELRFRRGRRGDCLARLAGVKKRLDVLLVERGLAESRSQAQALVLAGLVPGYEKPGAQVDDSAELAVTEPPPYVSRAGRKLANAPAPSGIAVGAPAPLDVGASPGGFPAVLSRAAPPA